MPAEPSEVIQIDKMRHFVDGKKTLYGFCGPLMVFGVALSDGNWVAVMGPCPRGLIQKIDDGKCTFVTDEWGGFFRLFPEKSTLFW